MGLCFDFRFFRCKIKGGAELAARKGERMSAGIIGLAIGLAIGGTVGILVAACCAAEGESDIKEIELEDDLE